MRRPLLPVALAVIAIALALAGLTVAVDNPELDSTSRGDNLSCLAPWDTVLNHADNIPGGEYPPDAQDIGRRCIAAGRDRFDVAVKLMSVAGLVALAAGSAAIHAARRRRFGTPA